MAQEDRVQTAMPENSAAVATSPDSANEAKLAEAVRAAETQSAEDHAALMRVRRKLVRTMMVALTTTFIALGIVIVAIIYKFAHEPIFHHKAPAAQVTQSAAAGANVSGANTAAQTAENVPAIPAVSPFIVTAPNSGGSPEYFRKKQAQADDAQNTGAQGNMPAAGASVAPEKDETEKNESGAIESEQKLPLNPGEKVISQQLSGSQLLMRVANAHGAESIIIYDINKGKIITRIAVGK